MRALAALALLGLAGTASAEPRWDAVPLDRAPAGVSAPDFALPDLDGRPIRLGDLRGRHVVLNFWASWCAPCEMELPAMQRLQDTFPPSVLAVIGVNYREAAGPVGRFLRARGVAFRVLLDPDGAVFARYQVGTLPFTVVLDRRGEVVAVAEGPRQWDAPEIVALLRALARESR